VARLGIKDAIGERSLGRLFRRVHRLLAKRMQAQFSETDKSFEEWMALRLIYDQLVENAGELARDFAIGTGAATRLIDSLEKQGFIERDRTSDDRRMVLLRLTARGEKHCRDKVPDMIDCWNDLFRDFKREELDQLIALLAKLEAAF
jgi:DNA-binding MarR family transcriptional regulator